MEHRKEGNHGTGRSPDLVRLRRSRESAGILSRPLLLLDPHSLSKDIESVDVECGSRMSEANRYSCTTLAKETSEQRIRACAHVNASLAFEAAGAGHPRSESYHACSNAL